MVETNIKGQREVRYLSAAAMKRVLLSTEVKENSSCFRKILLNFTGIKAERRKKTHRNPSKEPEREEEENETGSYLLSESHLPRNDGNDIHF